MTELLAPLSQAHPNGSLMMVTHGVRAKDRVVLHEVPLFPMAAVFS